MENCADRHLKLFFTSQSCYFRFLTGFIEALPEMQPFIGKSTGRASFLLFISKLEIILNGRLSGTFLWHPYNNCNRIFVLKKEPERRFVSRGLPSERGIASSLLLYIRELLFLPPAGNCSAVWQSPASFFGRRCIPAYFARKTTRKPMLCRVVSLFVLRLATRQADSGQKALAPRRR